MAETNLRQAETSVKVTGILAEKDLKIEVEDGVKKIKGSLTLKTSDVNFIKFPVNVSEKKKDGSKSAIFDGMDTIMREYKSIADVGEDEADRIAVNNGELNLYRSKQTGKNIVSFKTNFFSRIRKEDYEPFTEFSVETYIKSIVPEVNNEGEETGRVLVHGWIPTYSGIEPIVLVAEDEIATAVENTYESGQTVKFYGDIVNNRIETIKEIPMAIGKPRIEKKVTYRNDLVINGSSDVYEEGVTANPPYSKEAIDRAIQERENAIAAEKEKDNSASATARPSAASRGRTLGF